MTGWPFKPGDPFPPTAVEMNAIIRDAVAEALDQRPALVLNDVKRLDVKPGDTIVIRCAADTTMAEFRRIREAIEDDALPAVRVLVLPAGVSVEQVIPAAGSA